MVDRAQACPEYILYPTQRYVEAGAPSAAKAGCDIYRRGGAANTAGRRRDLSPGGAARGHVGEVDAFASTLPPRTHAISNCARRPPSSLMALAIRRGLFTRTPYQHLKQEVVPRVLVPPEDGGGHEGNRAFAAMASVGRRPSKAAGSESAPAGSEGSPPWGNHIIYMSYMMLSCYNMFLTVSFYVFKTCP